MSSSTSNYTVSFDLTSIYQNVQDQRTQLAQYAIMQAATYMQNNKTDQAVSAFKKALGLDPQNTTAYNYLGQIYMSQGKNADAIKAFQQIVRIQSNAATADGSSTAPTLADAHISLGNAYLQNKQYTQSEKEYKTAARLNPQNPVAVYTLGQQYITQNRLSEAEAQFKKVQKLSPKDGNVYYALGQVYNKEGKYDEAATNLEKSLTLKTKFPSANYELGVAYNGLGRTADAKNQLSILKNTDTTLASQLQFIINKPQMVAINTTAPGAFNGILGPSTPLWYLDPSLAAPNSSKTYSVTISFTNAMDVSSITNPQNWSISRANSTAAGFYNNMMPVSNKDATILSTPQAITYNPLTNEATVNFRISQNAAGTAVIDPSHIVFKFSGQDASGRSMDQTADEVDGSSTTPF
ncbi:tetratricopeptide repeat protein [Oryzomonas japonica]|uniref:Tetratricopeptide repeat protein n=1 Tax=Oryzomonas japonica TaxID=2603858 RepID=A0A7J4ZVZ5_9BACT|nr:tetratricopeptide repeat protein [Oryzomonas japonica]KAB0667285.1 tetratricopeptide repeat protein [Oryzomonas japonica]